MKFKFDQDSHIESLIQMIKEGSGTDNELIRFAWRATYEIADIQTRIEILRERLPKAAFIALKKSAQGIDTPFGDYIDGLPPFGNGALIDRSELFIPREFWIKLAEYRLS